VTFIDKWENIVPLQALQAWVFKTKILVAASSFIAILGLNESECVIYQQVF